MNWIVPSGISALVFIALCAAVILLICASARRFWAGSASRFSVMIRVSAVLAGLAGAAVVGAVLDLLAAVVFVGLSGHAESDLIGIAIRSVAAVAGFFVGAAAGNHSRKGPVQALVALAFLCSAVWGLLQPAGSPVSLVTSVAEPSSVVAMIAWALDLAGWRLAWAVSLLGLWLGGWVDKTDKPVRAGGVSRADRT